MSIVTRYLLLRALWPTLVALLLLCGLIFLLQIMRLGHHVVGGGLGALFVCRLALYSLPTLVVFALPLALAAGLLHALGRLADTNQLLALRLAGIPPSRLAVAGVMLSAGAALITLALNAHVEPAALARLSHLLRQGVAHVLIHGPRPGRFLPLVEGTTLYVERRLPDRDGAASFSGFMLARDKGKFVILAREASMRLARYETQHGALQETVVLLLRDGELQEKKKGGLRRVRFRSLRFALDLEPALRRHLGFLAQLAARQDRIVAAPLACLALGLLISALGLGRLGQGRMAGLRLAAGGLLAVGLYQAGLWGVEMVWPGPLGAAALSFAVMVGSLVSLTRG